MTKKFKYIILPLFIFVLACVLIYNFLLVNGYFAYFHYIDEDSPVLAANQCYFKCAEEGFWRFPKCVKENQCDYVASIID